MAGKLNEIFCFCWSSFSIVVITDLLSNVVLIIQAKMGMTDDFESSLQVLRGFDTDITVEVNEIKVNLLMIIVVKLFKPEYLFQYMYIKRYPLYMMLKSILQTVLSL